MAKAKPTKDFLPQPFVVMEVNHAMDNHTPRTYVHPRHILSLRLRGKGHYRSGPDTLPSEGAVAGFLPAGEADVNGLVGPVHAWWVSFDWPNFSIRTRGTRDLTVRTATRQERTCRWKPIDPHSITRMQELFRAIQTGLRRQDLSGLLCAKAFLLRLFAFYLDLPSETDPTAEHRALHRFSELLRKHAFSEKSLEQLAEMAGGSADHLRELFRRQFGTSPVTFRTQLRMYQARELLTSSDLNVSEVAKRCGYPDPLYFSRVFRKTYNVAPREMILNYRKPAFGK